MKKLLVMCMALMMVCGAAFAKGDDDEKQLSPSEIRAQKAYLASHPGADTIFADVEPYLMATTTEAEFSEFLLRKIKRINPEITKVVYQCPNPQEGTRRYKIKRYETVYVSAAISNNRLYGLKVGVTTIKMLNVPIQLTEYVYENGWKKLDNFRLLGFESFKNDPRVIVKNIFNHIVNFYTSPNDRFVRGSIFEPIKHSRDSEES